MTRVVQSLTDQLPGEWLATCVSRIDLVPELDFGLAEAPAEEHLAPAHLAGEVDESEPRILELDAEVLQLALVSVDLTRKRLDDTLQGARPLVRLIGPGAGSNQVELQDGLSPTTVLLHDIVYDLADQRERAIRVFDGEQLHDLKDTLLN
jgi:hypothetical protein